MKKISYINILGFILLIVLTACAPEHTPLELGSDNSKKLYQQGKIDPAITAAKKAIAENPDNAGQAWYYLAISYSLKGKKEEARNAYMRVLATENGFFDASADVYHSLASRGLGLIYYNDDEDFDRALDYFNKSLEFNPIDTGVVLPRSGAYLSKGLYRKAISDINIALSRKATSEERGRAFQKKAYAYLGLGDTDKAFALLKKAQQASPAYNKPYDEASFYYALGEEEKLKALASRTGFLGARLQNYAGKESRQLKAINVVQVVKDSPAEQAGLLQGDLIISMNGKPAQETQSFIHELQSMMPGTSVSLQVQRKGEEKKISVVLGTSPYFTPERLNKNRWIAVILKKSKAINKAMLAENNGALRNAFLIYSDYLRNGSKRPIEYEQDIIERMIRLYRRFDPPPAIPEEARRHATKAAFYSKDAKTDEDFLQANAEYEQAARLAPWWADIYFNYALAQQRAGDYTGAIHNLKLFLLAAPDDPAVGKVRSTIYTLEAQVQKYAAIRRWEGKWLYGGSLMKLKTKGDAATMVFIKTDKFDDKLGFRPGDIKLSGSISNEKIKGKYIKGSSRANVIRCFGKLSEEEMTGQLSPDGQTIKIRFTLKTFTISTCAITGYNEATAEFTRIP